METFSVHRPSPHPKQMMHKEYPIQYTWSISSKRRNKLQHIINGNVNRQEMKDFCDKLAVNDIPTLIKVLREKFPNTTKWSTRGDNTKTRAWCNSLQVFAELISGGEVVELFTRFLSSRASLKAVLSKQHQETIDATKLERLRNNYKILIPQTCRSSETSDAIRDDILLLLNDVLTKDELTDVGSTVGEKIYLNMRKHVQTKGMVLHFPEHNKKVYQLLTNLKELSTEQQIFDTTTVGASCKRACLRLVKDVLTKDQILSIPGIGEDAYKLMRMAEDIRLKKRGREGLSEEKKKNNNNNNILIIMFLFFLSILMFPQDEKDTGFEQISSS